MIKVLHYTMCKRVCTHGKQMTAPKKYLSMVDK